MEWFTVTVFVNSKYAHHPAIKSPIVYSPLQKSPIDRNQIFDGYNVFIYKLKNVKKFVTYFDSIYVHQPTMLGSSSCIHYRKVLYCQNFQWSSSIFLNSWSVADIRQCHKCLHDGELGIHRCFLWDYRGWWHTALIQLLSWVRTSYMYICK